MAEGSEGPSNFAKPLWFGPDDRPLFGWLHAPAARQVRGGVVLSPPLGFEAVNARHAYRYLAEALSEAGFAALRFDYDGTGDSAGRQDDPGRVNAWSRSLHMAIELVKGLTPGRLSVVGMRMGATLAADILGSGPALVDDLVLWDPCASGRAFLREQSALWTFAVGAERVNDGSVETPGVSYSAQTVSELSGRAVATGDGPLADRVLVLMRAGRTGDRRMNERLAVEHAVRMDINGQEDLVDVQPDAAKIPEETVETIVSWLAETGPTATMFLDVDTVGREAARIEVTPGGVKVEERVIRVGPVGLFGMMTSPPPPTPHTGGGEDDGPAGRSGSVTPTPTPTVLFFNAGVIDHVGPARLWVELARQWAAAGIPSFRFDISGIGDSPVHEGQSPQKVFTPQGKGDVAEVLRTVSPTDPSNSVLVGLCSGADYAIEEAIGTKVRGVCAINPVLAFKLPEPGSEPLSDPSTGEGPREVTVGMKGWVQKLQSYPRLTLMAERLPSSFWGIINRVAAEDPPVKRLVEVVDAGATVLVIAGTKEARWLIGGAGRTVRKLARSGRFRMEVIPDLEHTLFERRTREIAAAMLSEHIIGHFGPLRPG